MRWLLASIFIFFGLHTLLWLPRSAIARRAAGRKQAGSGDAGTPRR